MVNDVIRIGIETNATSMKTLSTLSYQLLRKRYRSCGLLTYFYLPAISKAAGILASSRKSIKRGKSSKYPHLKKSILSSCYGFKVTKDGYLQFPISKGTRKKIAIPLSQHALRLISAKGVEVRSFTLTLDSLSLFVRKKTSPYVPKTFFGIDINASNVTYGNASSAVVFGLEKVEHIARTTRQIVRSFKRNDVRIRKKLLSKYGKRRSERFRQILNHISKTIVENAMLNEGAIVFEDIKGLRNLYKKGNLQGRDNRARMNSLPWFEIKRQIEYKAAWEGVPVLQLSKGETRGTSKFCPRCGERLQEDRHSRVHRRELWCGRCGRWLDRDVVAVMNISYRGWLRFGQSTVKGGADEAMVQEPSKEVAILKVDASKLGPSVKAVALLISQTTTT